jgi:hypothetical protein
MCGTGEVMGVDDAIVPPIPVRDAGGIMLSGALRMIEQLVGSVAASGGIRAGFDR